jgi:hypothetical protein
VPECHSVSGLLELRKFRRPRQGIDASKLTVEDGKKKKRLRKPEEGEDNMLTVGSGLARRYP